MRITKQKIFTLKNNDPVLAELIEEIGDLTPPVKSDNHLKNACRIIVDQQISYKAAHAIWKRLDDLVGNWQAERIITIEIPALQKVGLSKQKANYIRTLASSLHDRRFSFEQLTSLDDAEATSQLIKIKGYGRWSAEMFLIFSLDREDVFSADDAGLKRAVKTIYELDEEHYQKKIDTLSKRWAPYRSIASLYLWQWHDSD